MLLSIKPKRPLPLGATCGSCRWVFWIGKENVSASSSTNSVIPFFDMIVDECFCLAMVQFYWFAILAPELFVVHCLSVVSSQLDIVSESCRFSMTLANASLPKYVMLVPARLITNSMKSTATVSIIVCSREQIHFVCAIEGRFSVFLCRTCCLSLWSHMRFF